MTSQDIQTAIYYATAYQSIMRTSIRNPNNMAQKLIQVPDLGLAEYLNSKLPGSTVERLDVGIPMEISTKRGRRRKHSTNSKRAASHRRSRRRKLLEQILQIGPYPNDIGLRNKNVIEINNNFVTQPCVATLDRDLNSSIVEGYVSDTDLDVYIDWLKELHLRQFAEKEENFLISPAIFDPNHPNRDTGKRRGRNNIVYLRHLWLDFEEGDLKPEEFAKLFPTIRMVITNSFRHTDAKPRFRVFIPVLQPLPPDAYERLWDIIAGKLIDAGYQVRKTKPRKPPKIIRPQSGLDYSKRTAASLFYLPCQAEDPTQSFFTDYNEQGREVLDAELWIDNTNVVPFEPYFREPTGKHIKVPTVIDQAKVGAATAEWRKCPDGDGDNGFFNYAVELRDAGIPLNRIAVTLNTEAEFANSPKERRAQIKGIIGTLSKSHKKAA
jgi:hypothetical protein